MGGRLAHSGEGLQRLLGLLRFHGDDKSEVGIVTDSQDRTN